MREGKKPRDELALGDAARHALEATAVVERTLRALAASAEAGRQDTPLYEDLSRAWRMVLAEHERAEVAFAKMAEVLEDLLDAAEARAALREPGASIPWEHVKSELGLP